jgi:alpha-N-arabinofuranosidase
MFFSKSVPGIFILCFSMAASAAGTTELLVKADEPGARISRQIYGQFAEHLGRGIYEGLWVGKILLGELQGLPIR